MRTNTSKKHAIHSRLSLATFGAVLLTATLAGCGNGLDTTAGSSKTPTVQNPSPGSAASATPSPSHKPDASPAPSTPASSPSAPSNPSEPSPEASSTSGSSPAPSDKSSSGSSHHDSVGLCSSNDLAVGTRQPDGGGAAGSSYVLLTFKNTASSTCFLNGHPGVSFVGDHNGTQLGDPAQRMSSGTTRVTLKPGGTTTALLRISNAGNYDAKECAPTTADGLRVYPPDSRTSVFVPFKTQACQRSLEAGPQLSVSAVGRSN